jgi:hypothetical protein
MAAANLQRIRFEHLPLTGFARGLENMGKASITPLAHCLVSSKCALVGGTTWQITKR